MDKDVLIETLARISRLPLGRHAAESGFRAVKMAEAVLNQVKIEKHIPDPRFTSKEHRP